MSKMLLNTNFAKTPSHEQRLRYTFGNRWREFTGNSPAKSGKQNIDHF